MPAPDSADPALADDLDLIVDAARKGGEIAMRYFRTKPQVWMKGTSPVSEADYAVDKFLYDALRLARPTYGWLSEETADTPERLGLRRVFVVDPIDGTRAYLDNRETWCVSIGVVEDGRPLCGVLVAPARGEIFSATLGGGSWLNGERLSGSPPGERLSIGGPKPMLDKAEASLGRFERAGYVPSLAYRIAMVAAGRIDATFVKPNAHHWDLAAADIILTEAGGGIVNSTGSAPNYALADPTHGSLVAAAGHQLDRLGLVLAGFGE